MAITDSLLHLWQMLDSAVPCYYNQWHAKESSITFVSLNPQNSSIIYVTDGKSETGSIRTLDSFDRFKHGVMHGQYISKSYITIKKKCYDISRKGIGRLIHRLRLSYPNLGKWSRMELDLLEEYISPRPWRIHLFIFYHSTAYWIQFLKEII
jgi:hypothetical protein